MFDRALLVQFVETKDTNKFYLQVNRGRLYIKQFLKQIITPNTVPAKKIAKVMRSRASASSKHLKLTLFASFPNLDFQKIYTKQVCQVLRALLATATYAEKDHRVRRFLIFSSAPDEVPWPNSTEASFRRLLSTLHG